MLRSFHPSETFLTQPEIRPLYVLTVLTVLRSANVQKIVGRMDHTDFPTVQPYKATLRHIRKKQSLLGKSRVRGRRIQCE